MIILPNGYRLWLRERLLWRDCRRAYRDRKSSPADCLLAELEALTARVEDLAGFVFEPGTLDFEHLVMAAPIEMLQMWYTLGRERHPQIVMIYLAH